MLISDDILEYITFDDFQKLLKGDTDIQFQEIGCQF